jgi:hypothetical protein
MGEEGRSWARDPPVGFDPLILWLDEFGRHLVLLDELSLSSIQAAVRVGRRRIVDHLHSDDPAGFIRASTPRIQELMEIVRSDHRWFDSSLEELAGLLRIVEGEDQEGHRQALGQYLRILASALARHRRDEVELAGPRPAPQTRPLRNPN